jgi:hypothetical protein
MGMPLGCHRGPTGRSTAATAPSIPLPKVHLIFPSFSLECNKHSQMIDGIEVKIIKKQAVNRANKKNITHAIPVTHINKILNYYLLFIMPKTGGGRWSWNIVEACVAICCYDVCLWIEERNEKL